MNLHTLRPGRELSSVAAVRRWIVEAVTPLLSTHGRIVDDVAVMTSELVTNVIAHTLSEPRISVAWGEGAVRVAVSDDDPSQPVVRSFAPQRVGGNGLRIVDAWSEAWGVDAHEVGVGKTVWFEVRSA